MFNIYNAKILRNNYNSLQHNPESMHFLVAMNSALQFVRIRTIKNLRISADDCEITSEYLLSDYSH